MSDFSSSEESEMSELSSSDSDLEDVLEERVKPKNKNFFEETVPQFTNTEFIEHFRVSKQVGNNIANRFEDSQYFKAQSGPHGKLSAQKHTFVFLWFAGHQTSSFRDVADRFDISISCLHRVLIRVIYFLSNLAPEVIKWPSREERVEIQANFYLRNQFPGIVGAVDGTHIKIDKPIDDPESYINRKGFYSIQVGENSIKFMIS